MNDEVIAEDYKRIISSFLTSRTNASVFCEEFTRTWMAARDKIAARKMAWDRPYDEMLIASFQRGELAKDEFKEKYNGLWGIKDPVFDEDMSAIHSACSVFSEKPSMEWEIDSTQLRHEVEDISRKYWSIP